MNYPVEAWATFGLLGLAICCVWLKPVSVGGRGGVAPWALVYAAAVAVGTLTGYLKWQALVGLAVFIGIAYVAATTTHKVLKVATRVLTGLMVLGLYMNLVPGFTDVTLAKDMVVSEHAKAFTHHAKFGPVTTGLILFAFFCQPARTALEWRSLLRQAVPIIAMTLAAVFALGLALGYMQLDLKWTAYTGVFLIVNLLFTCVAEEAFFRGFLQEQFTHAMSKWRLGPYVAVIVPTLLFALAHARGGPILVLLATVAGGFYAFAFCKTKRLEASILTHFSVNALHFLAFTYPSL